MPRRSSSSSSKASKSSKAKTTKGRTIIKKSDEQIIRSSSSSSTPSPSSLLSRLSFLVPPFILFAPPKPSTATTRAKLASHHQSSKSPSRHHHDDSIVVGINGEVFTPEDQHFAAWLILPFTSIGYLLMVMGFNYYLGHKINDHLEYAIWPSCAFATAFLLWHRYEPTGWRRNVDIATVSSAISLQTYNTMTRCECDAHRGSYLLIAAIGIYTFYIGASHKDFRFGMKLHLACHFIAYFLNILLYRCIAMK